ncbi:MAG: 2-oxoacid:acceptor oxidoreductase subunit alpha [Coriobacteriia bacterium]|nr:2-oxoacid:acceptor oxidoreductase subunit alpha [Coriobacteriia bacterium]
MSQTAPYGREVRIRIGGPAGFGIKAAGQSLARVFAQAGYRTFDLTEYPSLIKGGHNTYHLRVSADPITSHVMATDILVALDRPTARLHIRELTPGGALIYDPKDFEPDADADLGGRDDVCLVPVPLTRIVDDAGGIKIMRNVAALGATLGHMGMALDGLESSIRAQFAHKAPEIAAQNIAIAQAGLEHAQGAPCAFPFALPAAEQAGDLVLADGNEAFGLGALAAGVGFYAAYPMTPASSLLHFMAKHGDAAGVVVKHTEDEIAAMNMVLGSAFGGTRSMCATAGGGFSLMVEAFGFAGVSETACVVGLFTRPGPATGLPTWTEQSDLRFALHASQGEFPRVVLAPGDHAEAFEYTWRAFNLADELQTPVILLGDSYLSDNRATSERFDVEAVEIRRGKLVAEGDVQDHPDALAGDGRYARYKVTEDGVSVRALPGVEGAIQVVNSYEHDEFGYGAQAEEASIRVAQNEKRLRKLDLAASMVPPPNRFGPDDAEISLVFFGSTKMPALQALQWLHAEGHAVNAIQVTTLWPFPAIEVCRFLCDAKINLIIEGNATGQLEGLIREQCLHAVHHRLRRYDGRPFSPELIYATVKQLLGEPVELNAAGALVAKEDFN